MSVSCGIIVPTILLAFSGDVLERLKSLKGKFHPEKMGHVANSENPLLSPGFVSGDLEQGLTREHQVSPTDPRDREAEEPHLAPVPEVRARRLSP